MAVHYLHNQRGEDAYRGHLPPPFYDAKDENPHRRYLMEPGSSPSREDLSNYGKGGYYGNTYQERGGSTGARDSYRHLGDRRWSYDSGSAWEREFPTRQGYRSMPERIERHDSHRGKRPRSYTRRDERILEDVGERMYDDPFLDASDVEVTVHQGEVILSGTVPDLESKRRAEDVAEAVSGVRTLENRLRIKKHSNE